MAEYLYPVDIGNRALDHCGVPPIVAFTDDSKAADRVNANYDKLRIAELRRNKWVFSIRKAALRAVDTTTMLLVPDTFDPTLTYPQGSIVTINNLIYFAAQAVPVDTTPGTPNEAYWTVYFGPMTVTPYDPTISYYTGELVYDIVGTTVNIYQCLTTGTIADPRAVPPVWDATVVYNTGDTVTDTAVGNIWQSTVDLNINNDPLAGPGPNWEAVPATQGATQVGQDWLQLNVSVRYQRFQYPLGAGPARDSTSKNIFRLPFGFLRRADQDPKAGAVSYLGAPGNNAVDDWVLENNFVTSRDQNVIIIRFVADIQDVSTMDPMFCEGLGARIGLEICEPLTQSDSKLSTISQIYKTFMSEARAINGIEEGSVEPPLDDYLATRI